MAIDLFTTFANGQVLTNLDSTGVKATSQCDVETGGIDGKMDAQAWLGLLIQDKSFTGLTEGMEVKLMTSDSETFASGNVDLVCSGIIPATEIVKGARMSWGFISRKNLKKYVGVWFKAISTAATGTIKVSAWLDIGPMTPLNTQVNLST